MYIVGKIEAGDEHKFKDALLTLLRGGQYIHMVSIYSPGGSVSAAIDMGTNIRKLRLLTYTVNAAGCNVIRGTRLFPVEKKNCLCASACFLVWAGGPSKGGDRIQVHRISYDPQEFGALSYEAAKQQYRVGQNIVESYLKEMDVPDWIIRKMMTVPSNTTALLSKQELEAMETDLAAQELKIARCGPNWRDAKVFKCNEKIDREIFAEAAQRFLAENTAK